MITLEIAICSFIFIKQTNGVSLEQTDYVFGAKSPLDIGIGDIQAVKYNIIQQVELEEYAERA